MKRAFPILFLGLALIVTGLVNVDAAQTSTQKVGFIDLQRTLLETKVGKNARKKFESEKKRKQAALDKKQRDFQKRAAELDRQKLVLKPEVLAQKQRELEKMYVEVTQTYAKLERELAEAQTKLIQDLLKKAGPVIKSIAKADGYTLILDRSAVLWADQSHDITGKVNSRIK